MTTQVLYVDYGPGDTDRPKVPTALRQAVRAEFGRHDGPFQITREHDRWFAGCLACGRSAEWSGAFELVEDGDGTCRR